MGLDNYFRFHCAPGEQAPEVTVAPQPKLCGGLFSGASDGSSFRGKAYSTFVFEITGRSLYEDFTPAREVLGMAEDMEGGVVSNPDKPYGEPESGWEIPHDEIVDLVRVFRISGEKGFDHLSWY